MADLITQAKDHINTLTPAQLAAAKAQEELENWKQSCEEAEHAGDLNQLTESLDKEHMYYQNMRQAMLMRAKALNCTFDKQRGTWISPLNLTASQINKETNFKTLLLNVA